MANEILEELRGVIRNQQEGHENEDVFAVGEQLLELAGVRAELEKALEEAKNAKQAELEARERVMELQKKMQMSSPLVAEFKAGFETLQDVAARLLDLLGKIRAENPETGGRLAGAMVQFGSSLIEAVEA